MICRFTPLLFLTIIAALLLLITAKNSQALSQDRLWIQTGMDFVYDDNVWQFSDSDRQAFKDNPNQSFFQNTESLDDLIWQPFIHLRFRPPWREGRTQLLAKITGSFYTKNIDLNFQTYRIGIKQELSQNILASATYTVTPNLFVGQSRERRTQTLVDESFTSHLTVLRFQQRFQPMDLGFSLHYRFRDYNDPFNEQDTDIYGAELFSDLYPISGLKAGIAYQFELGRTAGHGDVSLSNDLSYLSHRFQFRPQVQLYKVLIFDWLYEVKYKDFTTNQVNDTNHYNREDFTHRWGLHLYYQITQRVETTFAYERIQRTTNVKPDFFSYDENNFILGINVIF